MALRAVEPLKLHYRSLGLWQDDPVHRIVERHAQRAPDRLAAADQEHTFTYGELATASRRLATWLADLELPPGTPVAFQTPSSALLPVVHMACDRADLIFVPLTDSFKERELRHLLRMSRAAVAFVPDRGDDRDRYSMVAGMRDDLPDLRVLAGIDGRADLTLERLISDGPAEDISLNQDADAPRHCMITSGTTELSRISLWTGNNLWFFLSSYRDFVEMTDQDVALGLAPANGGSTGYVFPVLAPLLFGATSVLLHRWDVDAALDEFARLSPTLATAIPTQILQLLNRSEELQGAASSLRAFNNAGAPLPAEAAARVEELLGCRVQTSYGASDGGVPAMTRISDPTEKRHGSVGRPLDHTEIRLVDVDLADVAPGEPGEVLWRNATKSFGYLNDDERTAATFWEDGWYRSGDVGVIDEDGYLHIVGRRKDMILRGGRNISPAEIEQLLLRSGEIAEVGVIGVPDDIYGEVICACVVPTPGASPTLESLRSHLVALGTESYKLPDRVEVLERLPRNAGEKLDKRALAEQIVGSRSTAGAS